MSCKCRAPGMPCQYECRDCGGTKVVPEPREQGMRLRDVERKLGVKKSVIYDLIKNGDIPAPAKLGRASVWSEREIDEAFDRLLKKREQT